MKKTRMWLAAALLVVAAGCSDTINGVKIAEPEIERFREMFAAKEFEKIYDTSAPAFREAATKDLVIRLFDAIDRKLGSFKSAQQVNWNVNTQNFKTTVVLVYASKYAEGEATETFTILVEDQKPALLGYNINSLDMMLK